MKLAEALQERADLQRRIEQLSLRLSNNALVQEGEVPAEDPQELVEELDRCIHRLETLICRINLTNCQTKIHDLSLTELLAKKDCLTLKLSTYQDFIAAASHVLSRTSKSEIKILSTISVKDYQKTMDAMCRELRILDNQIQECNWLTELQ